MSQIQLYINGTKYTVESDSLPSTYTLNDYIRDKALLKGTKAMCKEGGCGVCTVTVIRPNLKLPEEAVNSCLVPIYACNGWNITTIEGLGNAKTGYNEIQKDLADYNGSQCGFCSPGMVMTMYGATKQNTDDLMEKYESYFDGNICRCTGYRPIMSAMLHAVPDIEDVDAARCNNCPHKEQSSTDIQIASEITSSDGTIWYQPKSLTELESLVAQHSGDNYYIVSGHTGVGVYKKDGPYKLYISIANIPEMHTTSMDDDGSLSVGAGVTLSHLISTFTHTAKTAGFSYLTEAARYLDSVANPQVRNLGCWAGNLIMKHKHNDFPSDVFTLLECVSASLTIYDCVHSTLIEKVSPSELLSMDISGMVILSMKLSPRPGWNLQTYKIMPRYRNAHTLLSLAMFVSLDSKMKVQEKPSVVYAGVSSSFAHAMSVEYILEEKTLSSPSTIQACMSALDSVKFDEDPLLPSVDYRKSLCKSLLYKAILSLCRVVCKPSVVTGGEVLLRADRSTGSQTFDTDPPEYPLTQPTPKLDARKQTAGEAQFIGDLPEMAGQLHAVYVKSTQASADVKSVDTSLAVTYAGVISVLTYKDIPGKNEVFDNEPLLAEKTISYYGQPIALVIAETEEQALAAREVVKVEYENMKQPILSIEDAIQAKSFFPKPGGDAVKGDAKGAIAKSDIVVSGSVSTGEQYAMHTETQTTLVQPEEGYYVVFSATQVIHTVQNSVARILGITTNEVEVRVRRVGGGFGAKQARSTLAGGGAALAAFHTQRPVKMCLSLQDNMEIVGRRQPLRIDYQVGVNKDMKIQAISGTVYENAGYEKNEILGANLCRFLDNAYFIPNWNVDIQTVKTNQPNHCYVRTPGIISMTHFAEQILEDISAKLNTSSDVVRAANFYTDGQKTPYGEVISPCYIQELWDSMKTTSQYDDRLAAIKKFNSENMWRKKGLGLMPLRYGMSFWPGTGFTVHVTVNYGDASVIVIHGGIEIGQGINTKAIQQAAHTLGISMDMIKVQPTNTVFNVNCSATGGSVTSDMNCVGVVKACQQILATMKPYKKAGMDWKAVVAACKEAVVDLHAKCFITDKDIIPDPAGLWAYNVFGTACTEVELDVLTGNHIIHRMDIIYDCGASFSPLIDVGQIEGGIVMGLGLFLTEESKYDPKTGQHLTHNTWTYKVPMNRDIPVDLRVNLLHNRPNKVFSLSSKIVGEPPLLLAESAVIALRNCISAYRKQQNKDTSYFKADAPFTVEKVLLALQLDSSKFVVTDA